jgi:hypothetical protein
MMNHKQPEPEKCKVCGADGPFVKLKKTANGNMYGCKNGHSQAYYPNEYPHPNDVEYDDLWAEVFKQGGGYF